MERNKKMSGDGRGQLRQLEAHLEKELKERCFFSFLELHVIPERGDAQAFALS